MICVSSQYNEGANSSGEGVGIDEDPRGRLLRGGRARSREGLENESNSATKILPSRV